MIEQIYKLTSSDEKLIERVIIDENINYNHIVLAKDDALPEHSTNAVVYMTVLRGNLTIQLNEQELCKYQKGTILKIPFNTKMNVKNIDDEALEITIVKAPAPM